MEVVYKLRHKPTGLFYHPVKGRYSKDKTNIGKKGKIYTTKAYPKMNRNCSVNISERLVKKLNVSSRINHFHENMIDTKPEDWEVVEYELKEKNYD